jgi:hypothetical protein
MSTKLSYLKYQDLAGILSDAWQNQLGTEMDPADGQWFSNGPQNNGGLYGNLQDKLDTEVIFTKTGNEVRLNKTPQVADSATLDNRDGKSPTGSFNLSKAKSTISASSKTETTSLLTSAGVSVEGEGGIPFFGKVKTTVSFRVDVGQTWSNSSSQSNGQTTTSQLSVDMNVPAGKVYKTILTYDEAEIEMPYECRIILKGNSVANFRSKVNGKNVHTATAGELCKWINEYNSAGEDSHRFRQDPDNPDQGYVSIKGVLKAKQNGNYLARTEDVTDSLKPQVIETKAV